LKTEPIDINMKITGQKSLLSQKGFSLVELVIVCALLSIVLGAVFNGIDLATKRGQAEMTKVDLTQEGPASGGLSQLPHGQYRGSR
jgi:prepilin-type N-terminal cleavage/methylation domain-containing protein